MPASLFNKLISTAKNVAFQLKEKQKMTIEDHVLEHMLFYHDLAGSSLENNKAAKILKADIKEAIERQNISQLSLALKIPPKLWEEHLKNIVSELSDEAKERLGKLLLSSKEESADKNDSYVLKHEDWMVRANAANILGFLDLQEAAPYLAQALKNDTTNGAMAFCYIAYSLGKLKGPEAQKALSEQLNNQDPWLRVDAAGALACLDEQTIDPQLTAALLNEQEALDYMAYAVSRSIKPACFLQSDSEQEQAGGARLIFGLIEACDNSFRPDVVIEAESHFCLHYLIKAAASEDPVIVDTGLSLCAWLSNPGKEPLSNANQITNGLLLELEGQEAILKRIANSESFKTKVMQIIDHAAQDLAEKRDARLVHALRMASRLDLNDAQLAMFKLLEKSDQLSLNELSHVIIALSQLSENEDDNANKLIDLAQKQVDLEARLELSKSKNPVAESNLKQIKIYWEILRALGNTHSIEAAFFLVKCLDDYAPDMRACALESLIEICKRDKQINLAKPLEQILQEGLKDPSAMMQLAALLGVKELEKEELYKDLLPLINSQENTVSKQSIAVIAHLAKVKKTPAIKNALEEKLKSIKEEHKRERIRDILQNY